MYIHGGQSVIGTKLPGGLGTGERGKGKEHCLRMRKEELKHPPFVLTIKAHTYLLKEIALGEETQLVPDDTKSL